MRIKFLLLLLLTFISYISCAQTSSLSVARAEYKKGNYEDAVLLFNGALATINDHDTKLLIAKECELSSKCWKYLDMANSAYYQKRYEEAKRLYSLILGINRYDENSSYKIKQCNIMIGNAADHKYWATVVESKSIEEYENYIQKYPSGLHIGEAKRVIANVVYDRDLWNKAVVKNTKSAYQAYLSNTNYGWHKEEAEAKINVFADQELWDFAERTNTKAAYNNYLSQSKIKPVYTAHANAKIALLDAKSQYEASNFSSAQLNYEKYIEIYLNLSPSDKEAYAKCCEETDYAMIEKRPSTYSGKVFIEKYPYSQYTSRVKSLISRQYADENQFSSAELYSQKSSDDKYIKFKKRVHRRTGRNGIRYALGFGNDWDFAKNSYSYGFPVQFSVGSYENLFNVVIGAQYRRMTGSNNSTFVIKDNLGKSEDGSNMPSFQEGRQPHLLADQISVPAYFRFNFGDERDACQFFMAFGGSCNFNVGSKYKRLIKDGGGDRKEYDKFTNPNMSLVNKSNISTIGKVGLVINDFVNDMWYDLAFVVRYDLTPAYNINAINTFINYNNSGKMINFYDNYMSIQNQVTNRLYFGFSLSVNFQFD